METGVAIDPGCELWVLLQQACDAIARDGGLREFSLSNMQACVPFIVKAMDKPPTHAEISR